MGYSIQDLSNETGIPVYQLSPLINGHFNMNFANWVNRFRIEYLIELVPENPQLTLEAVSKKAGFISRSTFINAFKKEKGVTPREYFKGQKSPD
jgi:AraC-like DNA-binding protein